MTPDDLLIRPYETADEAQVINLWRRCNLVVPANDPQRDLALKLAAQPDLLLVATFDQIVVATVMIGYDGHRGWINYLAVAPDRQRTGIGRRMMAVAEDELRRRGCPKLNLQVRNSNRAVIAFYRSLGFAIDDVISLGKRL